MFREVEWKRFLPKRINHRLVWMSLEEIDQDIERVVIGDPQVKIDGVSGTRNSNINKNNEILQSKSKEKSLSP